MTSTTLRVLVVDDNAVDRERIRRLLKGRYDIVEAETAHDGLAMARAANLACVLLDYRLPDRDGVDVIADFTGAHLPVLMLTSQGNEAVAVDAMKRGALDYLCKSALDADRLQYAIGVAVERTAMRRRLAVQSAALQHAVTALERKTGELERSNQALIQQQNQLRVLFDQLPAVTWTTDDALTLTSVAGRASAAWQAQDTQQERRVVDALFAEDEVAARAHREALDGHHAPFPFQAGERAWECSVEPLRDARGRVSGTIGVALEVTERRALERQLNHAAKMEALGKLTGGLAHDLNNILTAILGFTEFALESLPAESSSHGELTQVIGAAGRATELVRHLLAFSRVDAAAPRVVDVGRTVEQTLPIVGRLVGEDITVTLRSARGGAACIDPTALEQVIVNLVVNARDAIAGVGGIDVDVDQITLPSGLPGTPTDRAGAHVMLAVSDTGAGIPPELMARIFEPFFTTKALGKGTGLGLSNCHAIVQRAGGAMTVESRAGRGTTFRVFLPLVEGRESAPPPRAADLPGGTETILVVDDDPQVRSVVARALRRLGYTVLDRPDGASAIAACREHGGPLHLLLCDVVMPDRDGPSVAAALRAHRPELRVMFMSGYTERGPGLARNFPEGEAFVPKPLSPAQLARAVRDALDGASRA